MLFGRKKPEDEAKRLLDEGAYDELLDFIYRNAIESGKMKQESALAYAEAVLGRMESARVHHIVSLLLIPDRKGLVHAEKAFEMEPTNGEYAESLAMYYSEGMKDEEGAMGVYERYWNASGDIGTGIFVAEYWLKKGRKDRAAEICREILLKDPNNRKAAKILKKAGA